MFYLDDTGTEFNITMMKQELQKKETKQFTGTIETWQALSAANKGKYEIVNIIDDPTQIVLDNPPSQNSNDISSGVYKNNNGTLQLIASKGGTKGDKGDDGDKGDKGDTGDSGVYIGATAPTNPSVLVWIDTSAT